MVYRLTESVHKWQLPLVQGGSLHCHIKKLLTLTNGISLAISGGVTLWDPHASSLGPPQIVYMTLNFINGVVQDFRKLLPIILEEVFVEYPSNLFLFFLKKMKDHNMHGSELTPYTLCYVGRPLDFKYPEDAHFLSKYYVYCKFWILVYFQIWKWSMCSHNIIKIHNNVLWDWSYSVKYFQIFLTYKLNVGNIRECSMEYCRLYTAGQLASPD